MNEFASPDTEPHADQTAHGTQTPIVGIGASAGGVEALLHLLPLIAPGCGLSFVVVQHLDPQARSMLPELLGRVSRLPVRAAADDMPVEPETVYIIPPNATLTIQQRRLCLGESPAVGGFRTPIDSFLLSLADDLGESAACVILSGTGSDGTIGLRAIKEHGGLALAQAEAEYDGMMRSAVATGLVDQILPLQEIPAKLVDYFRHLRAAGTRTELDGLRPETAEDLAQVYALLRARTGHDFREYKERTVIRRVQRRMQVLQIDTLSGFIARLRQDPRELDLLFQDLLIGVTNFFRDPPAFEALERLVIPHLFAGKGANDTVRVWVPGCSTGQEAYSIAMLLREHQAKSSNPPRLQIFAGDIDEHALEVARVGRYPGSIAKDVPAARLERHFVREDGTYRVISELREICLFSGHNLLRDAPFSRLDLLSCRNLLIYLNPKLQNRVFPLFHYALHPNGYLFLGPSENVTRHARLFSVVDKNDRIYQRRAPSERRLPEFPLTAPNAPAQKSAKSPRTGVGDLDLQAIAERRLLERFAPAYVVVNQDGELLHASARTGRFLELPAGAPDSSIFSLARRGLRLELRATLHRAVSTGQVASQSNIVIGTNGGRQTIELFVQPLRPDQREDGLFLVVFKELGPLKPETEEALATEDVESVSLRQLEAELRATREKLQITTEELKSSNEELKSSNEELSSMNEELQSANEELETSREELQSINEELQTVNFELNSRVDELSRANSDMANLLESTQIATLFLDRDLCVKNFTPAAKDLFRLVESDTNRPIGHVRARFTPESIQEDAERVLRTLGTIERQVRSLDSDAVYVMRMLPYRTVDNIISGVVLTFTDLSRISAAEARIGELTHDLRNRIESLETLLDLLPVGVFIVQTGDGEQVRVNGSGAGLVGEATARDGMRPLTPRPRLRVDDAEIPDERHPLRIAAHDGEATHGFEAQLLRVDGGALDVMFSVTPLFDETGKPRGAIGAMVDISERKAAEAHQRMLLHELQHRVKNILAAVSAMATRMLRETSSPAEFREDFLDRLLAMSRLHDLLSENKWQGIDLRALLLATLAPFDGARRHAPGVEGPPVQLGAEPSGTLGLVLHELATNAAKYGALSVPDGAVTVHWRIEGDRLVLTWIESGGPPVREPGRDSFGLGFVRRSVQYELDGSIDLQFPAEGLRAVMTVPLPRAASGGPRKAIP